MRRIISNYRFQPYIRHGNTSDGQSPVETDPEDAENSHADEHNNKTTAVSQNLLNVMQTEYIGPPGPTAEEYRMNNMIANGWGSEPHTDSSDTEEESPHLLLLQTTAVNGVVRTEFHPSIFGLVMISILAALAFLGVNLRMGALSIAEGIIPF